MRQHGSGLGGLSLNWRTWVGSYISRTRGSDANGLEYVDDTTEVESSGDESIRVASPKIGGRHVFSEVVGDPPSAGSGGNKRQRVDACELQIAHEIGRSCNLFAGYMSC